jgi:hypothetical protein
LKQAKQNWQFKSPQEREKTTKLSDSQASQPSSSITQKTYKLKHASDPILEGSEFGRYLLGRNSSSSIAAMVVKMVLVVLQN